MKIGVLSHYHNTTNYGGALQAYALCKVLNDMGYDSEQIDADCFAECTDLSRQVSKANKITFSAKKILRVFKPVYRAINSLKFRKDRELRKKLQASFRDFNENLIPHSDKQYDSTTINNTLDIYDVFIVGSDQVWNPIWYFEPFFLTFVPKGVPKLSYAASISQPSLADNVKRIYKEHLKDFSAISVREKSAVDLLSGLSDKKIEHVLDPVLLPERECWENVTSERFTDAPYVFCYFLGSDSEVRNIAKEYAKSRGLKLINIKHAAGNYHASDINYGDISPDAPSPSEFLSLIKYADTVFTDSFHASVFSFIFKRQFFVFERTGHKSMSTRITSLMSLFETENRFCDIAGRKTFAYISAQNPIDYEKNFNGFETMRNNSLNFLRSNLNEAEKKVKKK